MVKRTQRMLQFISTNISDQSHAIIAIQIFPQDRKATVVMAQFQTLE